MVALDDPEDTFVCASVTVPSSLWLKGLFCRVWITGIRNAEHGLDTASNKTGPLGIFA